ncbi:hypothetical protein VTO42DRAFT_2307 [Malbranchea cinnamomea]
MAPFQGNNFGDMLPLVFTTAVLLGCMGLWLHEINSNVPEPYLDEVFHVGQALAYWQHQWRHWDPKITTPPGLYVTSYLIGTLVHSIFRYPIHPSAADMRYTNGLVFFNLLPFTLRRILSNLWGTKSPLKPHNLAPYEGRMRQWELSLTVLNICLFPPIFFFSGLYYTDLAALLIVLYIYSYDLQRQHNADDSSLTGQSATLRFSFFRQSMVLVVCGLLALLFRQTNIFWVAVFIGGLKVVRTLKSLSAECKATETRAIAWRSWDLCQVYDPSVGEAYFGDYLKASISLTLAALANIRVVLFTFVPYLAVLGAFALFVLWNGGVVLGHKEFHTAGLHLPQMLYIWPYFMFFSWPIILLPWLASVWQYFTAASSRHYQSSFLPRLDLATCCVGFMLVVVHFNTIVHPFTLADNRHYVFYVFRILRRHLLVKYAVTPIYFICAWLCFRAFGQTVSHNQHQHESHSPETKSEFMTATATSKRKPSNRTSPTTETTKEITAHINDPTQDQIRVSFVLVWLASTSLSLITAPLVEPRYFIIPWVMWRLHVPRTSTWLDGRLKILRSTERSSKPDDNNNKTGQATYLILLPLVAELAWYVSINGVTGYIFLRKGFEWPQEPGKVQRFMW